MSGQTGRGTDGHKKIDDFDQNTREAREKQERHMQPVQSKNLTSNHSISQAPIDILREQKAESIKTGKSQYDSGNDLINEILEADVNKQSMLYGGLKGREAAMKWRAEHPEEARKLHPELYGDNQSSSQSSDRTLSEKAESAKETLKDKAESTKESMKQSAQSTKQSMEQSQGILKNKAESTKESIKEKAQSAKQTIHDKYEQSMETASGYQHEAASKLSEITQTAADKLHSIKETVLGEAEVVREKASELSDSVTNKAHELKEETSQKIDNMTHRAKDAKDDAVGKAREIKDNAADKAQEMRAKSNQKEAEMTERLREKAEELRQYQNEKQHEWSSKPSTSGSWSDSTTIKESRDFVDASDKLARSSLADKSDSGMSYTLKEQPDIAQERMPSLGGFRGLRNELGGEGDGIRLAAMSQDFSEL